MPKVSIVTPTYNRQDLLPVTIDSILSQSFDDFEYMIVDDGSSDQTRDVVQSYGSRIGYFYQENRGEAASTNFGWQQATGRYFAVVSSDDPMLPGWLEECVAYLDDNPDIIAVYPDWLVIDSAGTPISSMDTYDYSYESMVSWLWTFPGPGTVIRKEALSDIQNLRNPGYRYASDLECWLRLGLRGAFARIPKQLAAWRQHVTSITVADRSLNRAREMIRLANDFFMRDDLPPEIRRLRTFALSRAYNAAAWVIIDTFPELYSVYLKRSYILSQDDPPNLPKELRRNPEPDTRPAPRTTMELKLGRLESLWPDIRDDMLGVRDVERGLSGAATLGKELARDVDFGPPALIGRTLLRILDAIPRTVQHLLVLPWLGLSGGSDQVSRRFIRLLTEHYSPGQFCILGLDEFFDPPPYIRQKLGSVLVSVPDHDRSLKFSDRLELLDRILIQRKPANVHTINSYAAWDLIKERGAVLKEDMDFYGHIYADIRINDVPVEVFWHYLPDCVDYMKGVISDNQRIVNLAESRFGLTRSEMQKFHVVRTPIVGLERDPREELRPYSAPGDIPCTLWFGRFSPEKRPHLVGEVASLLPARRFAMYGPDVVPKLREELEVRPNVEVRGEFVGLADLPFGSFDSYMLTSSAEGVPLSVMEATQYGLPVVAPDVGAVGEFVDAETGWLVEEGPGQPASGYAEALLEISRDKKLAARKVQAAQRRLVERHSWRAFEDAVRSIQGYLR